MENTESENLKRHRDSSNQVVVRFERALEIGELERLKLDDKLQATQRKCDDLEKTVARLLEETRVSTDRQKTAEDLCEKISAENSKISFENHNLTLALDEKVRELRNEKSENERLAGICQEEFKCFDAMVEKLGRVIRGLRQENSDFSKTVEELKLENAELRRGKTFPEGDAAAQPYKSSLEALSRRMGQIEEELAGVLSMKVVGDLATFANEVRELATPEGFADSEGEDDDDSSGNAENGVALSAGSVNSGLSKKGDEDLVQPWTIREDGGANAFEDFPQAESNECEEPLESGEHSRGTRLMCGEGCFSKSTRSSSDAGYIIDINDSSDDEANPDGPAGVSNKRNRTEFMGDCFSNSTTKRKRNMATCDEDDLMSLESEKTVIM